MNIDPNWVTLLLRDAPYFVAAQLFGPNIKTALKAWVDRGLAAYNERTKTKALLARAEGDAQIEQRKKELDESTVSPETSQVADTSYVAIVVPELDLAPIPTRSEDPQQLLSLGERARHAEQHRGEVKQQNLEAVFTRMLESPPPQGDPGEARPSRTWLNRFAEGASEAQDEDVRDRWAKLLAGEIVRPGRFSLQTLSILRDLSSPDAQLFATVCQFGFWALDLFLVAEQDAFSRASAVPYGHLVTLSQLGLLTRDVSIKFDPIPGRTDLLFTHASKILRVYSPGPDRPPIGLSFHVHAFTRAGAELSGIVPPKTPSTKMIDEFRRVMATRALEVECLIE